MEKAPQHTNSVLCCGQRRKTNHHCRRHERSKLSPQRSRSCWRCLLPLHVWSQSLGLGCHCLSTATATMLRLCRNCSRWQAVRSRHVGSLRRSSRSTWRRQEKANLVDRSSSTWPQRSALVPPHQDQLALGAFQDAIAMLISRHPRQPDYHWHARLLRCKNGEVAPTLPLSTTGKKALTLAPIQIPADDGKWLACGSWCWWLSIVFLEWGWCRLEAYRLPQGCCAMPARWWGTLQRRWHCTRNWRWEVIEEGVYLHVKLHRHDRSR